MIYIEAVFNKKSHLHNVRMTLEDEIWYAETSYCPPALEHLHANKSSARDHVEGNGGTIEEAIQNLKDNLLNAYAAINHQKEE